MNGMKKIHVGDYLSIAFCGPEDKEIILLYDNAVIKKTNADDKIGKKIFILDAVDIGAKKTYLAKALGITYQTIKYLFTTSLIQRGGECSNINR